MDRVEDCMEFAAFCLLAIGGLAALVSSALVLAVGSAPLVVALYWVAVNGMGASIVILFGSIPFHRSR